MKEPKPWAAWADTEPRTRDEWTLDKRAIQALEKFKTIEEVTVRGLFDQLGVGPKTVHTIATVFEQHGHGALQEERRTLNSKINKNAGTLAAAAQFRLYKQIAQAARLFVRTGDDAVLRALVEVLEKK